VFKIEYIEYLYLIGITPILLVIFYALWKWRKRQFSRYADHHLVRRLSPHTSRIAVWSRIILFSVGLGFIAIALANPQYGGRKEKVMTKSSDIFIALDISNSMMAEDISPSRLERAKRFSTRLIRSLRGDRIGLILFAGNAYLQMPLTADYAASELFVNSANVNQAGTQGTSFAEAIKLAIDAFEPESDHQKALIIISDGEDHEEEVDAAIVDAQDNGIVIFTIAVGSQEGAYIPVINRGREEFKLDETGQPVRSIVNLEFMADVAEASGGRFYTIEQEKSAIEDIKLQIAQLKKKEVEQRSFTDFNSYFQYFLLVAFILLLLEFILPSRKLKTKE
jgi:Ca-activated chloride channel family protein